MNDNQKSESKGFVREAAILSASALAVKIIGLVFKISLTNQLQEIGMGIFNAAYSIYAMLFMISTSGLPVAISRMVASSSEKGRATEVKKILRMAIWAFGVVGAICTLFLFVFAEPLAIWSVHEESFIALRVISPTLLLICIASAYRGYFQGLHNMYPTAISQFIEAFAKFLVGYGAAFWAYKKGYSPSIQASLAILGVTVGVFLGMLFMIIYKKREKRNPVPNKVNESMRYKNIARKLVFIALPVTITSSALYLSNFLDTLVINKVLISSGVIKETAEKLYSAYTSLAISLSDLLPSTLIYPIAVSILPSVASALAVKNHKKAAGYIVSSIRISGIIALPCSLCLCVLARPVIALVYGAKWGSPIALSESSSVMPIDIAATALSILSLGIFFISLVSTTNALLQAAGKVYYPMISVGTGVALLLILEVTLIYIKPIGIFGAPISSVACYIVALSMNMRFLRKSQNMALPPKRLFLKPLICSLISALFCIISYKLGVWLWSLLFASSPDSRLASLVILLVTASGAVIIYVFSMLFIKGITVSEIRLLPMGHRLSSIFIRKGWINDSKQINEQ